MSYTPTRKSAKDAYQALKKRSKWPGHVYPSDLRKEALREVLLAITCPIPCDGVVRGEGWHRGCEKRADDALALLFHFAADPTRGNNGPDS